MREEKKVGEGGGDGKEVVMMGVIRSEEMQQKAGKEMIMETLRKHRKERRRFDLRGG